jgi:hypothetical protein
MISCMHSDSLPQDPRTLPTLSILGCTAAMLVVFASILLHVDIPWPEFLRKPWGVLKWPFQPFINTREAFASLPRGDMCSGDETESLVTSRTIGRSDVFLSLLSLVVVNAWAASGAYQIRFTPDEPVIVLSYPFATAATWFYCFMRPLVRPIETSPLDLLVLNVIHLTFSSLHVGVVVSNKMIFGVPIGWIPMLGAQICQLSVALVVTSFVLSYPSAEAIPSIEIDKSPEDGMTLWGGMTYSWLNTLLSKVRAQRHRKLVLIHEIFHSGSVGSARRGRCTQPQCCQSRDTSF